jgi:DNA anti-recombination protein RmuC
VERTAWTDERMDDAMTRIDQRFDAVDRRFEQVDRRFEQVDRRFERLEERMDRGFNELSAQLLATNRQLTQIGWGLLGAVFVQMIVLLVAVS